MNYVFILSILFILFCYSNFINLKLKIRFHETILITICFIIILSYFLFQLQIYYQFIIINYVFLILLLLSFFLIPYILNNITKVNKKLNLEFILILLVIFFLSNDRYYLDQDEFTYWGRALKSLTFNLNSVGFNHHPDGLNLFRNLFTFNGYNEGIIIFSNNVILISGFFYLFYERNLIFLEKIILFFIYYLLLNNLSFGFLSIYSDPILATLYACLLKKSFFMIKNKNFFKEFDFILIFITLLLINRSAPIYTIIVFYFCLGLFFLNHNKKYKLNVFILVFIFIVFTYVVYESLLPFLLKDNFVLINNHIYLFFYYPNLMINELINFLFSPIYFSNFGVTLNTIFEIMLLKNLKLLEFKIPIIAYIFFLTSFMFFKFRYKKFLIAFSLITIVTYMIIILIIKIHIEGLHLSALPRYLGIMIIAKYFFLISIVTFNNQLIYKNYIFLFLLFSLFIVTPKKSFGFFVNEKIYYSNLSNLNFKKNRDIIAKLKDLKNNYDEIVVIHKKNYSDLTNNTVSGEHTFYHNIIEYELYPKKVRYIEYEDTYLFRDSFRKPNILIILFDLPSIEFQEMDIYSNIFNIKTYKEK